MISNRVSIVSVGGGSFSVVLSAVSFSSAPIVPPLMKALGPVHVLRTVHYI